jgi:hypothetical protein
LCGGVEAGCQQAPDKEERKDGLWHGGDLNQNTNRFVKCRWGLGVLTFI